MEGPGLPDMPGPAASVLAVAQGTAESFGAPAFVNSLYRLATGADILAFTVAGHMRLGVPGFMQDLVLAGSAFCTLPGGCACPPASEFAGTPPNRLSAETLLAVTGRQAGTYGTVTGYVLRDFCRRADGGA